MAEQSTQVSTVRDLVKKFEDSDPNDENYRIPPNLYDRIKAIRDDSRIGRYHTIDEFLEESIDLFTTWWTRPEETTKMMERLWEHLTPEMKASMQQTSPDFYNNMEAMIAAKRQAMDAPMRGDGAPAHLTPILTETMALTTKTQQGGVGFAGDAITLDSKKIFDAYKNVKKESESFLDDGVQDESNVSFLEYDGYPLIWSFYTRFFPAKVALVALGDLIHLKGEEKDSRYINFENFQNEAYNLAHTISQDFRAVEHNRSISRNQRFSTGLPIPFSTFEERDPEVLYMERKKIESSKKRYTSQYLGRLNLDGYVGGILNATGLAEFTGTKKDLKIGFTKLGLEFYQLKNEVLGGPISANLFDKNNNNSPLSNEEQKFIMAKIIPKFSLESLIVDGIGNKLKKSRQINAKIIDLEVDEALTNWIKIKPDLAKAHKINSKLSRERLILSTRIGTMGRLTELGFVNWKMEKDGSSTYTTGEDFTSLYTSFKKSAKKALEPELVGWLH